MVAHYEAGKDEMTIWSSTQNPHILRTFVARMVGLGQDRVRAIAPEVGGGFGAKINIYGEEYVAAALSKRLDMPLKWIEDPLRGVPRHPCMAATSSATSTSRPGATARSSA